MGLGRALEDRFDGQVPTAMEDLVTAGFVSRDFTWHLKTGLDSKLSHYRLKDNYLRFYLKYIEPNKKKIAANDRVTLRNIGSTTSRKSRDACILTELGS